jgi:F420-non-reducing hydrogenase large subunit
VVHPVFGLPGGVSKALTEDDRAKFVAGAEHAVRFAQFTLKVFDDVVLANPRHVEWILSEEYTHRTYPMSLVDAAGKLNFYDGRLRVVDPVGEEFTQFAARDYLDHIAEHVEPWSYVKFCYLKAVGWSGFSEGSKSGVYAVAPLARLNAAGGMATPLAQEACERYFKTLGGRPVHHTLANHWARLVELLYAAERMRELANDPVVASPDVRAIPTARPSEGVGVVEAPRGTLIHHYRSDERGVITAANLIVATQNNAARIAMSVDKAARSLIRDGQISDGILNRIEMAFRAYDPCHGCATRALPGQMPLVVSVYDRRRRLVREIRQG